MHTTDTSGRHQRSRVKAYQPNSDSYCFFNLLTSQALLDKVESLLPAHKLWASKET
jgi:hypothetical protein